ncbi:MAG TPA: type IVB secretion system apparatus protein IcmL/DotI [Gammaproteobacteria bacterium]|nr:type IVB secretion system apparatus protein IcmL/DotI [Gammaproteobacteria bacterium]
MLDDDAIEVVRLRNNFYRDGYRRVLSALLLLVLINIIMAGILAYLVTHPAKPQYFATTRDGKIIRMYPLSEPAISTSELLQWAATAATAANTYNFVNYRKELQAASEYFTPTGWKEYQDALKASRNLETVTSKKLTVNAVATGAPIIVDQGVVNGRYKWKIQMPILVTYESSSTNISQPSLVTMLVSRVSTLDTPKGIAIDAFYMTEQPVR